MSIKFYDYYSNNILPKVTPQTDLIIKKFKEKFKGKAILTSVRDEHVQGIVKTLNDLGIQYNRQFGGNMKIKGLDELYPIIGIGEQVFIISLEDFNLFKLTVTEEDGTYDDVFAFVSFIGD